VKVLIGALLIGLLTVAMLCASFGNVELAVVFGVLYAAVSFGERNLR
jgi:hypothetical protein